MNHYGKKKSLEVRSIIILYIPVSFKTLNKIVTFYPPLALKFFNYIVSKIWWELAPVFMIVKMTHMTSEREVSILSVLKFNIVERIIHLSRCLDATYSYVCINGNTGFEFTILSILHYMISMLSKRILEKF